MLGRVTGAALAAMQVETARLARSAQNVASATAPAADPASTAPAAPRAVQAVATAAAYPLQFADGGLPNADLAAATVDRIASLQSFKAQIAVFKTADEMTQSLLSIKA